MKQLDQQIALQFQERARAERIEINCARRRPVTPEDDGRKHEMGCARHAHAEDGLAPHYRGIPMSRGAIVFDETLMSDAHAMRLRCE
ncbi:hypothetical protein [Xanthobacter flavus]|uniref:hypothetical protein n=1 Tax=Xanthobacter flavus TaxID=281 RepID=UPI001AE1F224|nr:hypothetical protein [Xanthobacter flavus]MBP2148467.1 hypothetical protein [Xanthobacter flavus]